MCGELKSFKCTVSVESADSARCVIGICPPAWPSVENQMPFVTLIQYAYRGYYRVYTIRYSLYGTGPVLQALYYMVFRLIGKPPNSLLYYRLDIHSPV